MFLDLFPSKLSKNPVNPLRAEEVAALEALLGAPENKLAFKAAVNKESVRKGEYNTADEMISVYELYRVFNGKELKPQVRVLCVCVWGGGQKPVVTTRCSGNDPCSMVQRNRAPSAEPRGCR